MENLCIIKYDDWLSDEMRYELSKSLKEAGKRTNTCFLFLAGDVEIHYISENIKEATIRKIDEEGNITVEYKEKE